MKQQECPLPHTSLAAPNACQQRRRHAAVQGVSYRGVEDVASTGARCLPWAQFSSRPNLASPLLFPDSDLECNYCRNPAADTGMRRGVWCYTTTQGDWEYCDVPACKGVDREDVGVQHPWQIARAAPSLCFWHLCCCAAARRASAHLFVAAQKLLSSHWGCCCPRCITCWRSAARAHSASLPPDATAAACNQ